MVTSSTVIPLTAEGAAAVVVVVRSASRAAADATVESKAILKCSAYSRLFGTETIAVKVYSRFSAFLQSQGILMTDARCDLGFLSISTTSVSSGEGPVERRKLKARLSGRKPCYLGEGNSFLIRFRVEPFDFPSLRMLS